MTLIKNYQLKIKKYLVFLFTLSIFTFNSVSAYTETTQGGELLAEVSPRNPGPFTEVSIRLVGYEVDLDRSNIIWILNSKVQKEGIGENNIKFTTGAAGEKTTLKIEVSYQDSKNIIKEITIVPSDTDILWQSDSYTPAFYRGKALPTQGGSIKLITLPNFITESGLRINSANLVYKWSANSEPIASGYAKKNLVTRINSAYSENSFAVDISNLDGTLRTIRFLKIKPVEPLLLLYRTNPLSGVIYQKPLLEDFQMEEAETTIKLEPYFFDKKEIAYTWGVNNEPLTATKNNSDELVIRQPSGGVGESLLNILISSPYQSTEKSIKIRFGQTRLDF